MLFQRIFSALETGLLAPIKALKLRYVPLLNGFWSIS